MTAPALSYVFEARPLGPAHDGDTVLVLARLGFRVLVEVSIRLLGLNCPELRVGRADNPAGLAARDATRAWLDQAANWTGNDYPLVVDSVRYGSDDKYGGRADARVYRKTDGAELGAYLLDRGYARVMP